VYQIRLESVMAKIHNDIKKLLAEKPLTLVELAEALEKSEKKVYNALKKLFSDGDIDSDPKNHTYSLSKK
jgi:predicted transcriptional regulator